MKRETYKLKQLCSEIVDCVNKTAPTSDAPTPYKMLRTSDIREGKINLENLNCVTKEVYEKWTRRGKLQKGDVIFTREAPLGEVGLVREEKNYFLGQRLVLFRANDKICDGRFLMYSLLWHDNKQAIISKGVGSTVAHLRVPECENIEIKAPDLDIQHRIADILSAYDDLIENNQKQIKLLEEAAQRLYKEWFVDLHFPGHENTKIVDGVPEGWKKERLVDIAEIQYGYAFDGTLFNADKNGTPIIRIRNIPQAETMDYTTEHVSENYLVQNGEIIVGMDGEFHINAWAGNTAYLVQRVCCIRPKNTEIKGWLLQAIYEPIKFFERTVVGATVAHLGKKHLDSIYLLTSPEGFYKPFMILFDKRLLLENQNRKLREARDRLLPKLMSGEVEV
ncbi:restriction endonuclease subunit S [Faecalibacterium sp. BCRC 81149]|uniref:restriction endonuclease subunit S n=1 Tax=Faecalibacterium sp. BCRC 81149 TaxID=2315463 RepID=UPI001FA7B8C6|nr:restriction endonuclease subunit S [Faecalibacterium sp. BCRC 81149]MCI3217627.1 restriction endonuclease subunit S [Faecalibacterium sp. BCRC 81149]